MQRIFVSAIALLIAIAAWPLHADCVDNYVRAGSGLVCTIGDLVKWELALVSGRLMS